MGRYSNRFVLILLVNGQVQKDLANGEVHIPFNSEYTIRCRNKNNRRAVVEIKIDGETVGSFLINANSHIDIKRWADKDVAFKFVDLESPDAYDHGKQGPNPEKTKGLIEARFKLEKSEPKINNICRLFKYHQPAYPIKHPMIPQPHPYCPDYRDYLWNTVVTSSNTNHDQAYMSNSIMSSVVQEGCTVEGSQTNQKFVSTNIETENTETIIQLFLKGYSSDNIPVDRNVKEILPNKILTTPNQNSVNNKFCIQCGTARASNSANYCGNCGHKL